MAEKEGSSDESIKEVPSNAGTRKKSNTEEPEAFKEFREKVKPILMHAGVAIVLSVVIFLGGSVFEKLIPPIYREIIANVEAFLHIAIWTLFGLETLILVALHATKKVIEAFGGVLVTIEDQKRIRKRQTSTRGPRLPSKKGILPKKPDDSDSGSGVSRR